MVDELHDSPRKKKRKKSNKSSSLSRICIIHVRNEVVEPVSLFSAKSWEVISTKLTRISFSVHSTYFSFCQMSLNLMYHAKLRRYEMKSVKGICEKYKCL